APAAPATDAASRCSVDRSPSRHSVGVWLAHLLLVAARRFRTRFSRAARTRQGAGGPSTAVTHCCAGANPLFLVDRGWPPTVTERSLIMGPKRYDVAIIGGGIVGLATAWAFSARRGLSLMVLEAESHLAAHQ